MCTLLPLVISFFLSFFSDVSNCQPVHYARAFIFNNKKNKKNAHKSKEMQRCEKVQPHTHTQGTAARLRQVRAIFVRINHPTLNNPAVILTAAGALCRPSTPVPALPPQGSAATSIAGNVISQSHESRSPE